MGDILLDLPDLVVGLVAVVTRNTDELQLRQTLDVLGRDRTAQHLGKRFQPLADGCVSLLAGFAALDELIQFINDENPLQRSRMPCFVEFVQADFKLHFQQLAGMLRRTAQDLAHPQEMGFVIADHAAFGAIDTSQSVKA